MVALAVCDGVTLALTTWQVLVDPSVQAVASAVIVKPLGRPPASSDVIFASTALQLSKLVIALALLAFLAA